MTRNISGGSCAHSGIQLKNPKFRKTPSYKGQGATKPATFALEGNTTFITLIKKPPSSSPEQNEILFHRVYIPVVEASIKNELSIIYLSIYDLI